MNRPAVDAFQRVTRIHDLRTPLRNFLRTETGGAAFLGAATVAALLWANVGTSSYDRVWQTELSVRLGAMALSHDVRYWINSGLMALFFFVIGLEVRREIDIGELRERRRVFLPVAAGCGGILLPVAAYLAVNAGHGTLRGWGVTLSTDTAFALGVLALVARSAPKRLRILLLTVSVVDDIVALVVIATVYIRGFTPLPLVIGCALFGITVAAVRLHVHGGAFYAVLGVAAWIAVSESGVDPVVVGLAMGLLTFARPASRSDLQQASVLFRRFREQPTPALARSARQGLWTAISPNERLQQLYHPLVSYIIVPLFALANAGVVIDLRFLGTAFSSPVTVGILVGAVLGKPVGITGAMAATARLSAGRLRPPVGWASVLAGGAAAGVGFTISLLIADLAFHGQRLADAKIAILAATVLASIGSWSVLRVASRLPVEARAQALIGRGRPPVDLALAVDPARDHMRGPVEAPVSLVEYGDFECPYCGQAEPVVRELLSDFGDLRYVWRHLPLDDVHPNAELAAEAAEAAARQGAFWEMYTVLFENQDRLSPSDLVAHAHSLGLDEDKFLSDLEQRRAATRIAEDIDSADQSGVSGTPTFFINGRRHEGAYDLNALSAAVRAARSKATLNIEKGAMPPDAGGRNSGST